MTEGLLASTILPPCIPPSTTLLPHHRLGGGGAVWGRVVEGWMEGAGRLVDRRRPSVMASLTEVRAAPRTLRIWCQVKVKQHSWLKKTPRKVLTDSDISCQYFCFVNNIPDMCELIEKSPSP